ncbi:MAG TPA: tetratricopeptide repeat protein [Bacteroidia bacterium]|nr:tetratricopeptide repeat protein [Bacteroidia bacterium]
MRHYYLPILFLFTSLLLLCGRASAQSKTDSLYTVYKTAHNDSTRIWALLAMTDYLYTQKPDSAKKLWEKALSLATMAVTHDSAFPVNEFLSRRLLNLKADALGGLGYINYVTDNPAKGLEYTLKSLKIMEVIGSKSALAQSYNNLGYMYEEQGDLYTSIQYYDKSLALRKVLNDMKGLSNVTNNIGLAYEQLGDTNKALQYYVEAYQIRLKIKDVKGIATSLNNIATINNRTGHTDTAIKYYRESLVYAMQTKNQDEEALVMDNLASCFGKKNQLDSAFLYARNSFARYKSLNDKEGMTYSMGYMSRFFVQEKKLDSATKYIEVAMSNAKQLKYRSLIKELAFDYSKLDELKKDYKGAYEMYVLYKEMSDSITTKKAEKEAIHTQLKYEFEKRELEQKEQQKQEQITHKEELKRQHIIIWSVTAGLVLLAIFFFVLATRFRIIREQKKVIEEQKIIVEEKNKDMTDSIQYASRIQQTILPSMEHFHSLFPDSFVFWKPKDIVSGDFFWITTHKGYKFLVAADCTGHGVPGALMSMIGAELFNEAINIKGLVTPSEILNEVRSGIISALKQRGDLGEQKDGMDAALCVFEKAEGRQTIEFAGANNPLWIVRSAPAADICFTEILPNKQPIGIHGAAIEPFTEHGIVLEKGDILYIFSDGFADQFGGPKGKKFKYNQLRDIVIGLRNTPMPEQGKILEKTFEDWKGSLEQLDDVLVIGVRV